MKFKTCITKNFKNIAVLIAFVAPAGVACANVELPKLFSDNMVLQREHTIPVWGWADPKEKVTVQFNKQTKTVTTGKDGKWRIDLAAENAGGPFSLTVKGKNSVTINNVLVGDVWICSGQSNMEMQIGAWGFVNNFKEEIAAANYPLIRHFKVPIKIAGKPVKDVSGGEWKEAKPENAAEFTAVGYFFARELYKQLNIPIGLINTTWGGTQVESWTSREAFEGNEEFKTMISGMKNLDLEELQKVKAAEMKARIEKLQGIYPVPADEIAKWKEISYSDAGWHTLNAPGLWEQQEPGDFDGFLWVRKTIDVSAADAGKQATLEIPAIDDNDITYVNGSKVGETAGYNTKRKYDIPAGVLKAGKNVIAVRIHDTGGGGGIWGEAAELKVTIGDKTIPLDGKWLYRIESAAENTSSVGPNSYPTILYNAMISPLIPYAIKGVIWYQGESNAGRAYQYRKAFPLMITDWRNRWQEGDFPFYFVQLASFGADNGDSEKGSTWAELREAQNMTLSLPNTGMSITTDIGDVKDIHPKNKQDVGKRLAAIALSKTYNKGNVFSGPVYQSLKAEGNKAIVSFTNVGGGLMAKDKYGYLRGFEVAGADKKFHYAKAYIDGDKVVVMSDDVTQPVAVRFGWSDVTDDDNLYNKDGFPAGPFRTDDWKGKTADVKFGF